MLVNRKNTFSYFLNFKINIIKIIVKAYGILSIKHKLQGLWPKIYSIYNAINKAAKQNTNKKIKNIFLDKYIKFYFKIIKAITKTIIIPIIVNHFDPCVFINLSKEFPNL